MSFSQTSPEDRPRTHHVSELVGRLKWGSSYGTTAATTDYGVSMGALLLSIISIAIAIVAVGVSYYLGVRNTRAS